MGAPAVTGTDPYDEATGSEGRREPYDVLLASMEQTDLGALVEDVKATLAGEGIVFGDDTFRVDPVPRVFTREEWEPLAAGLCQRVRALDRFACDVYHRQRIVRDGVIPAAAISSAAYFEPLLQQAANDERRWITIAGLDVIRCPDGAFRVLEDNVRTPSGIAYAMAARAAVIRHLDTAGLAPEPLEPSLELLGDALRSAAPDGVDEPVVVVLTDGPSNTAYSDHRMLAESLGFALVRPVDLRLRDGHLLARTDDGEVRVDVVHAYVEDMVRFYLGEEPLIESVPTWDLSRPGALGRALEQLDRLVVKPRAGHGGVGVMVGPRAEPSEVEEAAAALRAAPGEHVVQDTVPLSLHPTVCDGRLQPRHVDLRPFVFLGADGIGHALPGGLTRVAFDEGEMVVNSSRNGGAKDTWVVTA